MSSVPGMPHGALRAPRVPLDLRCIVLGAVGWGLTLLADVLLGLSFDSAQPLAQLMGVVQAQLGRVAFLGDAFGVAANGLWTTRPCELGWGQGLVSGVVFLGIWSVFGGAILRTAAVRLTRNQTLRPRDALAFGLTNATSLLVMPLLIAAVAALLAGLNAAAGLVMSLWFIGSSILSLVLFPLVVLSSILIVVLLIGGFLGIPLMWAGGAIERNGALEPVSRTFSYVSARPFHFFFVYLLLFVVMSLATLVEGFVEDTATSTLQSGIVRDSLEDAVQMESSRDAQRQAGIRDWRNVSNVGGGDKLGFLWMWLCLTALSMAFKGYVIYLFLGGSVSLYLMLRREVDGTHEDELGDGAEAATPEAESKSNDKARWVGGDPEKEASEESEKPESES